MSQPTQEYLRVHPVGLNRELSVSRTQYDFAPDGYTVLEDKPATDAGGNPLPPKYKTSVSSEAAKKAGSGQKANSEGEN